MLINRWVERTRVSALEALIYAFKCQAKPVWQGRRLPPPHTHPGLSNLQKGTFNHQLWRLFVKSLISYQQLTQSDNWSLLPHETLLHNTLLARPGQVKALCVAVGQVSHTSGGPGVHTYLTLCLLGREVSRLPDSSLAATFSMCCCCYVLVGFFQNLESSSCSRWNYRPSLQSIITSSVRHH